MEGYVELHLPHSQKTIYMESEWADEFLNELEEVVLLATMNDYDISTDENQEKELKYMLYRNTNLHFYLTFRLSSCFDKEGSFFIDELDFVSGIVDYKRKIENVDEVDELSNFVFNSSSSCGMVEILKQLKQFI
jgi:hypothetical protein